MNAAHTPAPWTIIPAREYEGDDDELDGAIIDPASIEGANGDPVCSFGSPLGSGTLYENEADYHLITAAPELLAALVEAHRALMFYEWYNNPRSGWASEENESLRSLVDAAIAKATGGAA